MKQRKLIGLLLYMLLLSCSSEGENIDEINYENKTGEGTQTGSLIGKTLPDWQEGYLDIHAINTGRGESTLYIFPDGTTMLVDAASSLLSSSAKIPPTDPKPNNSISGGQVIANYVNHFINATSKDTLDYILLSHFHSDHMGSYSTSLPMAFSGNFRMGGITEVGTKVPFKKIIDRGYPDYNYPTDIASSDLMSNYVKFINWAKNAYGATAEQFDVGEAEQISLTHNPSEYSTFQVRNIVGNGEVWSGRGTGSENTLPSVEELLDADANENIFSIGFHISYGRFDYFAGGDLQYNGRSTYGWKDIEAPVANVMSRVEVMKANHHGTANCNGETFLNKLVPQVMLIQTWRDVQPNPETIGRMYEANSAVNIFITNITDANKLRLAEYISKINSTQGHLVVRVAPDGLSYTVYILEDTNEKYKVKEIFGPYQTN